MQKLEGLLKHPGMRLHAFRSGGGLRVFRVENNKKDLLGYAEAPSFCEALEHLEDDVAAGHRTYEDVYGKIYPHYLTGVSEANSNLDWWLLLGRSFDIRYFNNVFRFESTFTSQLYFKEISDEVLRSGKPRSFELDGIRYQHYLSKFANGRAYVASHVVWNTSGLDPWFRSQSITYSSETLVDLLKEVEEKLEYWKTK